MAEISQVHYVNAAQAVGKGVSGSEVMKATTICLIEDSEGALHIGSATTFDTTDDGERQAAAFAETARRVPADPVEEPMVEEVPPEPAPAPEPEPLAQQVNMGGGNSGDDPVTIVNPAPADPVAMATTGGVNVVVDAGNDAIAADAPAEPVAVADAPPADPTPAPKGK